LWNNSTDVWKEEQQQQPPNRRLAGGPGTKVQLAGGAGTKVQLADGPDTQVRLADGHGTQVRLADGPRTQVLLAAVLFGTTGTAQALGPELEPLAVGASRIVLGALLLALVALLAAPRWKTARRKPLPARHDHGGALQPTDSGPGTARLAGGPKLVLLAGVCVAVYQAGFFVAVADTGVAIGTVVAIGSAPAFTGLLGRAFAGERLERRWVAATALACGGVCLLVLGGGASASVSAAGIGLALVAGAGYSGYAVASKRMLDAGAAPQNVMTAVFGVGAVVLLPVFAIVPAGGLLSPGGAALVLYLAAVPTALAYVLFARGLERIGAGETATLTLAEPLTAAALGVIVLGERPGVAAAAGAALVLGGLALLAFRPAARRPAAERRTRERYGEGPVPALEGRA
jgi:drug/metabolite transporter, DME family